MYTCLAKRRNAEVFETLCENILKILLGRPVGRNVKADDRKWHEIVINPEGEE
jgi:hypothetical protein